MWKSRGQTHEVGRSTADTVLIVNRTILAVEDVGELVACKPVVNNGDMVTGTNGVLNALFCRSSYRAVPSNLTSPLHAVAVAAALMTCDYWQNQRRGEVIVTL